MFPISSAAPGFVPAVVESSAVTQVGQEGVTAVGSATDAPRAASVSVELSPVANFLLAVSQSREQLTGLQTRDADLRAGLLNDATQNVVNAFNLLPSVDFNQAQPQGNSLLNNLVQSISEQNTAQQLARVGVTLQPPLLSDATGGLSLDNEVLRAAFNTDSQATTSTLQNTLDTFSNLATRFAEQLSAAGTSATQALPFASQAPLTLADAVANAQLDLARADLGQLARNPFQETAADRLAAQRAAQEQPPAAQSLAPPSPIVNPLVNPLQASTAEVIAAQNAQAPQATQATQAAADAAAAPAGTDTTQTTSNTAQATADAARAAAAAQTARQQSTADLGAATAAGTQAAAQAGLAQNAAASAAALNTANATPAQQATAAQNAAANVAAANAAAASAAAQAQAAQSAADALAAQNAAATAAVADARAAQAAATTPEAANAAAAVAAQQAGAAQATAASLAAANAAAAAAAQQAAAAQSAATQASQAAQALAAQNTAAQQAAVRANLLQTDPLRANPALASAIAAYNINDTTVLGANARAASPAGGAVPRVSAVEAPARSRGIGTAR
ncbi:hypothetical protein [Duganella sp. LjRoot269]|jgi:hypothetical protein|uniref:hypothetical protein n=1 Tax=Duganella sp. LjRoot269 TaxID=3342305 RepID=UPI003ECFAE80